MLKSCKLSVRYWKMVSILHVDNIHFVKNLVHVRYTVVTVSIMLLSKYQKLQQVFFFCRRGEGGGVEADQMI